MYSADRELLGKAVLEALTSKYEEELKQCMEDASCSDIHLKKMSEILGYNVCKNNVTRKSLRKMWVAILIAAALLLVGCTAYVYREEIKGFIIEMHDKFVKVNFDVDLDEVPKSIEVEYTLGYVPEGFKQVKRVVSSNVNYQEWNNEEGESIVFIQGILDEGGLDVDNERGTVTIIEHGEYAIYLKIVESVKVYLWNNGEYVLTLEVPIYIADEDSIKIIDSIIS